VPIRPSLLDLLFRLAATPPLRMVLCMMLLALHVEMLGESLPWPNAKLFVVAAP
jgi:hypothetical protein